MPEPSPLAETFRTQFDAEVEKRFKAGFLNKVVERSAISSMFRNIVIGVLHDMNKIGALPNVPTSSSFSGQTALQYYRNLSTLVAINITNSGVVKFDSRALSAHLFNTLASYGDQTTSTPQLKEKPIQEEPRLLQFGRKLNLDDE